MSPNARNLIILSILLLAIVNLVFLDIMVFSTPEKSTTTTVSSAAPATTSCAAQCQDLIAREVSQILATRSAVTTTSGSPTTLSVPKEYDVYLGSGTTKSSTYDSLTGADAFINTYNYPKIQKVTFEVVLRNPTGNGSTFAKLFNVTDGHDVWFSEVSFDGGGTSRKEVSITLDPGNKEYQVRLKSTLQYDVYVDSARIKIFTY